MRHRRGNGLLQCLFAVTGQSNAPKAMLGHLIERTGDIDDLDISNQYNCSRCSLRQGTRLLRGHGGPAPQRRSLQKPMRCANRPDIVRIGQLIQHQDNPALAIAGLI